MWLFNLNIILKTCFKNLFRKSVKKWWYYSSKLATRTLQATLRECLHVKFHPGMKSSLSMMTCLLLFTRFCRDEISSRDELVLVRVRLHVTETKFYPGMKNFLFTSEFHPGMKRVESHPGIKFNLNEDLLLSTKTKIYHFSLIC